MKLRGLLVCLAVSTLCTPSARASLELGTTSAIGVNLESARASFGIGLDVDWLEVRNVYAASGSDSFGYGYVVGDATVLVFTPAIAFRYFFAVDRSLQPYIVVRARHAFAVVSSDYPEIEQQYEDQFDSWNTGLGGGIRSNLNKHLSIGGEVLAEATFMSPEDSRTDVYGGTSFLVFLQYHP